MSRIEELKRKVDELYQAGNDSRADWADWLYKNHIFVVAEYAEKLAERYHAKKELAMAAAMLHDIADTAMKREDPRHEQESQEIARKILGELNFSEEEIKIAVDDAIRFHSCRNGEKPESLEGKILATADAIAHLKTDFYAHAVQVLKKEGESLEEIKKWALAKNERDFHDKIFFDEIREKAKPDYERVKDFFSGSGILNLV
ncbi:MAG: Metal dependent phosphohydrolase [Parcubacteria group bacterium Gr01-1014_29]|nr:MAG: Metal dependent phosphohydrolase [Parcubacteria group bacterium Gr01-1014_29]